MHRSAAFATAWILACLPMLGASVAAAQESKPVGKDEASKSTEPAKKGQAKPETADEIRARLELEISKLIAAYDLSPQPLPEIPDDPPPHEGAMIDQPAYRIEAPDLVLIEVLEALPGRPISGERLVRADGTISLGFYGAVHVRGLTVEQAKVKIIKHMRTFLTDDVLGLIDEDPAPPLQEVPDPALPSHPAKDEAPIDKPREGEESQEKPREKTKAIDDPDAASGRRKIRAISDAKSEVPAWRERARSIPIFYFGRRIKEILPERPAEDESPKIVVEPGTLASEFHPLGFAGESPQVVVESGAPVATPTQDDTEITIRISVKRAAPPVAQAAPAEVESHEASPLECSLSPNAKVIPPQQSDRVFVDVTSYNSKFYYVEGHVAQPGALPVTGNETVLQAIQYAGGLLPSADSKAINLVRPGRNGKAPKLYRVDLLGITGRGETAMNYQLFPGDRIVVAANELARTKAEIERLSAKAREKALREKLEVPKADK